MESMYRILLAFISLCQEVARATVSFLASSEDPEAKTPLLPKSVAGLKKRQKSSSTKEKQMGSAKQILEPTPPDMVVRLGPELRISNSLLTTSESFFSVAAEVVAPLLLAGFGTVIAGIYLDMVSEWKVFKEVPEIMVLVPALLGLKGNLEMTLASRLSTESNLERMNTAKQQWNVISVNMVLVQCQATVVGLLSSLVAVLLVAILKHDYSFRHVLTLCASSTLTASLASLLLGLVTAAVVVISKKAHVNPDNIATPIAGSLGDITSLAMLSSIAAIFHTISDDMPFLPVAVITFFLAVLPVWVWISRSNKHTKPVLYKGWIPVIAAMFISIAGGLFLDTLVSKYKGLAVFQPVINGVGGNVVSIQASRMSTALHRDGELGELPQNAKICISPWQAFCSNSSHAMTARVLMSLTVPGHFLFTFAIKFFRFDNQSLSLVFVITYLLAASLQVAILLYIAYVITHFFWKKKVNPDNSTIPYLTAIGDLLGILLLGLTFVFLDTIGQKMVENRK